MTYLICFRIESIPKSMKIKEEEQAVMNNSATEHIIKESDLRLDLYIARYFPDASRTYAAELIGRGLVHIDDKKAKASLKTTKGTILRICFPEPEITDTLPEEIPLNIVYEDSDLLVINKAQGMVVHPAPGHYTGTLVHALLHHCKGQLSDINGVIRPGIVHRIDKDTSGLMLAVKNNQIHEKLAKMIADHEVKREYRCIVHGILQSDKGTIDAPIGRSITDRRRMTVKEDGKPSITHFSVLERWNKATDLLIKLETGRTHQIRAHMTFIGHPPVGDPLYAPRRPSYGAKGQALHSCSLDFIHPTSGEKLHFDAPLPLYYTELIQNIKNA